MTWRVPVTTQEPLPVYNAERMPQPADMRSIIYEGVGLGQVTNMTDLAGTTGKLVRIISIFQYIDNTGGVATDSWINLNHVAGSGILGQAFLNFDFDTPANGFLIVMYYIGASTVQIYDEADYQVWHCALPNILMDDAFEIEMRPNGGTGRYYILYEVFDK